MPRIEFFFDCSSPWTYLAFHRIQPLAAEFGVPIEWKPILVGGVFNAINPSVYQSRDNPVAAKAAYTEKDLQDWARHTGLRIRWKPTVFPVNSVKAMRGCLVAGEKGTTVLFARAVFEAYWSDDQDISQDDVLTKICERVGIDPKLFFTRINDQTIKDQLHANTDELIRRGGFGSPTIFIGDDMYFGNDRLPLVRDALAKNQAGAR
jgi:2-hydroxychromene-2-carboxylate isomerase